MFFEGAFAASGLGFDYDDFSIRIAEAEQHTMVERQHHFEISTFAADAVRELLDSEA